MNGSLHSPQNLAPGALAKPHLVHLTPRREPHWTYPDSVDGIGLAEFCW